MRTPDEVKRRDRREYQNEQDSLAEYVAELPSTRPRECIYPARTDLFADFQGWSKLAGESSNDRNRFYVRIRRLPGVSEKMERIKGH